ncbi:superoxide dismutase family protein [Planomonospora corallina]|uniref:Superoxide dismutase family protein n=1 Tax=Planomonospora corallina TaxID=1806052 RepID=A0ABV8IBY6_9ACTN
MLRTPHLALAAALGAGALAVGPAAATSPQPPDAPMPTDTTGRDPAPDDTADEVAPTPTGEEDSPAPTGTGQGSPGAAAQAELKDVDGRSVGSFSVEERDGGSMVTVTVKGLPDGFHGFHLHGKGVCNPDAVDPETGSPFSDAGPHLSLESAAHPDHTGDMPDLLVDRNGDGNASFVTDRFRVDQLLDTDGTAVIVHEKPDNQANIPDRYSHGGDTASPSPGEPDAGTPGKGPDAETLEAGDSGRRIACGVLTRR